MLATTRKIDNLGRIVIPKEMRDELNVKTNDKLLVQMNKGQIFIEPQPKDRSTYDVIWGNLRKHYPDLTDGHIDALTREYIMYDS